MQKKIIHIIYNLARGGAETMLVHNVNALAEYDHMIVTLQNDNHFIGELNNPNVECLNCPSPFSLFKAILKFKKIIKGWKPDLVHSHLIIPNYIARCSVPKRIPLLTTIHNSLSHDSDYKKWRIRFMDRFTFSLRRSIIIGVSKIALSEYVSFLKKEPYKKFVLYTFVNEEKIKPHVDNSVDIRPIRAIAIGALRLQKNYEYLLNKFALLKEQVIELDIYGDGPLKMELQKLIEKNRLPVKLKGQVKNINAILPLYDLCISSSLFEGFSLAILEAMAAKVPLLLSNIESFKEQCGETALYFDLDKVGDFEEKFILLKNDKNLRHHLSEQAYQRVIENYTFSIHLKKLRQIYIETLS
ncbi:MAG: glycosyltransferase family 4 protein [Ginsengibacter sp.]